MGPVGAQGLPGERGETGETGITGPAVTGARGERGTIGPTGVKGPVGSYGSRGKLILPEDRLKESQYMFILFGSVAILGICVVVFVLYIKHNADKDKVY